MKNRGGNFTDHPKPTEYSFRSKSRQTVDVGFQIPVGDGVIEPLPLVIFVMMENPIHFIRHRRFYDLVFRQLLQGFTK